jgi:glycosyltransferase involved in cell wall biosynthesis
VRIAMIASPFIPCPPVGYGGIERVVDNLACELAGRGHDVTLFARRSPVAQSPSRPVAQSPSRPVAQSPSRPVAQSPSRPVAQSPTRVDLSPSLSPGRSRHSVTDTIHAAKALEVIEDLGSFDLIHNHSPGAVPLLGATRRVHLTTVHGDTRREPNTQLYAAFPDLPYVAVSRAQRARGLPGLNWLATVHPGIDTELFVPSASAAREDYLLHVGSLGRRKGTMEAIWVAKAAGRPLVVIGRFDPRDLDYCEQILAPALRQQHVLFLGERNDAEKIAYMQQAVALIHPLAWDEPFGLVFVEALACGIPVLTLDRGAASELVAHGRTGFVGREWIDLIEPARDPSGYDPARCRAAAEPFTVSAMASAYLLIYEEMIAAGAGVSLCSSRLARLDSRQRS